MTFKGLTERQKQSRNAAHTSTITHRVETNGWNQLDHSRRWITAGDGSGAGMDRGRRVIAAGDGWQEMDLAWRWIVVGNGSQLDMDGWPEVDTRRWLTGDGSQEMDHRRRITINHLSHMKLQSSNWAQNCRHSVFRRSGSTEYHTEHYSEMLNYASTCPSFNAQYYPESDPESHSYIAWIAIILTVNN